MYNSYTIEVTQADIDGGTLRSLWNCMVARAVKRLFVKDIVFVNVTFVERVFKVEIFVNRIQFSAPDWVAQLMDDYDENKSVAPFTFAMTRVI